MGAGGAGACAGAVWKEEGSLASGWTHGPQTPSGPLRAPRKRNVGPAFHENDAHVLLAAALASAGKAACLLLAMPGKA